MKGEEEEEDENLRSWQIVSVAPKLIEVDLEFDKPIYVSQGEVADKLIVQVGLSDYPDEFDATLPASVNRVKDIPLQVSSQEEAEAVGEVGSSTHEASTSVCVSQFMISLAM